MTPKQRAILCVDDEKFILTNIKLQLKNKFGDDVIYETADNPLEALEILDELMGSGMQVIIVSDWLMPFMKGDEFLIKAYNKYPEIVTILLTGQADLQAIERCQREANLHEYIAKPWSAQALIESVESGFQGLAL
jgi:CheY-like chemotaxis protein